MQSSHQKAMSEGEWSKYAKSYDPIVVGSIDGTDTIPHDRAIVRALNSEYFPNRHVKGRPECTIFVGRLSYNTTKETLSETFSKYGKIHRFRLVKDIVTGMPKGYAFIEYEDVSGAEEAYSSTSRGLVIDGNTLLVDFERERTLDGWRPRRLGGGFGGRKESGQLRFGGRERPFRKPVALELKEKEQEESRRREMDRSKRRRREEDERRHRRKRRRS